MYQLRGTNSERWGSNLQDTTNILKQWPVYGVASGVRRQVQEPSDTVRDNLICRPWWLTSVILAIEEAKIRRIVVRSQPRQIVHKTLSQKHPSQKKKKKGWWSGSRCKP
jgi:hypothetical protein